MLNVVKKLKKGEMEVMGFKTYQPITLGEGVTMNVKANSMAHCTPQEDLELEDYEAVELSIKGDELEQSIADVFPSYNQVEGGIEILNAPIEKVEELYNQLNNESTKDEKDKDVKVASSESQKVAKGNPELVKKFTDISLSLNKKFFEREAEIEGMLVALLSKQHILLI